MTSVNASRPVSNFTPSLWGDHFLKSCDYDPQVKEKYYEEIQVSKNEVRSKLASGETGMMDAMNLIDILERLGIAYHFEKEIEDKLQLLFSLNKNYADEDYDLYTVALHFRIFRQHGFHISCGIFGKWMDPKGKFNESIKSDIKGLLSLYEAAHLRKHGEKILDDALVFATKNLKSTAQNLESPLGKQVAHALEQALHLGCPRIEARYFIDIYEEDECKNKSLLRFAKLDYNLLQVLHKKELQELSRWWQELDLISKHHYARDRMVECFFWATGVYFEPQHSRARIMLTKLMSMTSVIDDTYDAYGTIQELQDFTRAIQGWDMTEIDQIPDYLKQFYKDLLGLYQQFEDELAKEGRAYAISYTIDAHKELVRSYNVEAKWFFIQGEFPPFEEYLNNGLISCSYYYHMMAMLLGMNIAVEKEFECLHKKPKMLIASLTNCRLLDDLASYEVEKERGQLVTGIECYMKENNVRKEVAMSKTKEIATNAWKDINEESLKLCSYSKIVVRIILNMSRLMDVAYKNNDDGYTEPGTNLKPHIISLFVDPIKL